VLIAQSTTFLRPLVPQSVRLAVRHTGLASWELLFACYEANPLPRPHLSLPSNPLQHRHNGQRTRLEPPLPFQQVCRLGHPRTRPELPHHCRRSSQLKHLHTRPANQRQFRACHQQEHLRIAMDSLHLNPRLNLRQNPRIHLEHPRLVPRPCQPSSPRHVLPFLLLRNQL